MRHHRLSASIKAWLNDHGWFNPKKELPECKGAFLIGSSGTGWYYSLELVHEVLEYDNTYLRLIPRHGLGVDENGGEQYYDRCVHFQVSTDYLVELDSPQFFTPVRDNRYWGARGYWYITKASFRIDALPRAATEDEAKRWPHPNSLKRLAEQERLATARLERKRNGARV